MTSESQQTSNGKHPNNAPTPEAEYRRTVFFYGHEDKADPLAMAVAAVGTYCTAVSEIEGFALEQIGHELEILSSAHTEQECVPSAEHVRAMLDGIIQRIRVAVELRRRTRDADAYPIQNQPSPGPAEPEAHPRPLDTLAALVRAEAHDVAEAVTGISYRIPYARRALSHFDDEEAGTRDLREFLDLIQVCLLDIIDDARLSPEGPANA